MNNSKKQIITLLDKINLIILGVFSILFPLFFLSSTTDGFTLPKQIVLIIVVTITSLIFCLKSILNGKVLLKKTPFNLPLCVFTLVVLISAIFSINRYDALASFVPLFFTILLYFIIINSTRTEKALLLLISCLTLGSVASGIVTILNYLKIYLLPFAYARNPLFNTYGSLLDEIMYLALILPLTGYFAYSLISKMRKSKKNIFEKMQEEEKSAVPGITGIFTACFIILALTIGVIVFIFFTNQKPLILPFETGFQTAFASISQDTGKIFKSFLLGSGYGTYITDFTRFKQPVYNQNSNLWSFTFFKSSSFILELLATVGFLGTISFLFLIYKIIKEKNFFLPLILAIVATFILPFSFTLTVLFIYLLAIFALIQAHDHPDRYTEIDLYIAAISRSNENEKSYSKILPIFFTILALIVLGIPNYFTIRYVYSDINFQNSLIAASQNQGLQTYNAQKKAIDIYPFRDIYHRGFAQTNLALASALVTSNRTGSPSAQVQQNILLLIQQAITSGRNATTVAPQTAFNWNALSEIYRSLIGFGQNADQFSVITSQQAISLDPSNPQQYVELGGIYYQIGLYDNAIQQFTTAANLKRDYANAYYNLGHALESKGDLPNALTMYKTVQQLVKNDPTNNTKITEEIKTLQTKIGAQAKTQNQNTQNTTAESTTQPALDLNKSTTQLPERKPQVNIPAPTVNLTPTPTKSITKPTSTKLPTPTRIP